LWKRGRSAFGFGCIDPTFSLFLLTLLLLDILLLLLLLFAVVAKVGICCGWECSYRPSNAGMWSLQAWEGS